MDVAHRMNATIPPLDYSAGLAAYSSGTCLDGDSVRMLYGMAPYQRDAFADALSGISCAGGTTPLADAVDVSAAALGSQRGDTALIIISDFASIDSGRVTAAVEALQSGSNGELCVHTVTIGDGGSWDRQTAEAVAASTSCGSAVTAADIAAPDSMANYVRDVLLAAAPPAQAPAVTYEKNTLSTAALFDFDSAVLKDSGKAALQELGDAIKARGARVVDIDIIGHTDSIGPAEYNMDLSVRRAESVRDYLVSEGVDAGIIDVSGEGETNPIASNDTAEGRAQNRRVEVNVGIEQAAN
jgi:OOP family OmpA-OmpF porin